MLAIAAFYGWGASHLDVSNAYLHGDLKEEIYMRPPSGVGLEPGKVLRLRKCLYGLRQSGREFEQTLRNILVDLGFVDSSV